MTRRALFLRQNSTRPASFWRGSTSDATPSNAIVTEASEPIMTEDGQYLVTET